jgi:general secretion pathway protein B
MSFILDALRKSDAERQRGAAPGLTDVRYAARRGRRNLWLPLLVVVLGANLVFLGWQWLRPPPAPTAPVTETSPAAVTPTSPAPEPDIRPLAREAEYGEPLPQEREEAPVEAPVIAEVAEPEVPDPAPSPASRIVAGNELPTVEELIGKGRLQIPILNLDLHVYSEQPAGRFVVINARKYKEGGQLSEGPTVETITRDGVILASQGQRFTLSRR